MAVGYWETLCVMAGDGNAIAATTTRTSMTAGSTGGRGVIQPTQLRVRDMLYIFAAGRISCVATTPGTARFDLAFGTSVGTANFDSLAINLNTTAKTNVAWKLEVWGTVKVSGTAANILWQGTWFSEALIASPLPTAGGSGEVMVPYNTAPVVGPNFDSTVIQPIDLNFTQTVATAGSSVQLHQFLVALQTSSGF